MRYFSLCNQKIACYIFILLPIITLAQDNKDPIRLFTECNCERSYIRQEINYIDHVRDQGLANVQLFIYDIVNGSGGRTYLLDFKGVEDYKDIYGKLTYETSSGTTPNEVREGLVRKIRSGLLKYILESNLADRITYTVSDNGLGEIQEVDIKDPWNSWIFEIYGEADLDKESSRREFEYELGFETDHVTEKWRIRTDLQMNQASSRFLRDEEEFTSERQRYSGDGSIVKSISDHWSVGIFAGARHDTFTNLDARLYLTPAIEYNIFPYFEVLRKEIVFAYKIGYFYNNYIDTTIFDKNKESLYRHALDVQVRYRQPWGNIYSRLQASSFLSDFSKNRIELFGRFSVRLVKGLAVQFSGRLELIGDQINLPSGAASLEDVLLQQKQIATDFEVGFGVGLSYTFGSAFNNIINTRL